MTRNVNPLSKANPHVSARESADRARRDSLLESGVVTIVPSNPDNGEKVPHVVQVEPEGSSIPIWCEVPILAHGDVHVPEQGDRVLIARRHGDVPMVLFTRYIVESDVPEYEEGDRQVGHGSTDTRLRYDADGDIHLVHGPTDTEVHVDNNGYVKVQDAEDDAVFEVRPNGHTFVRDGGGTTRFEIKTDGTVLVDGGGTQVVKDVTTTTDADGHVTSISLTRSSKLEIP